MCRLDVWFVETRVFARLWSYERTINDHLGAVSLNRAVLQREWQVRRNLRQVRLQLGDTHDLLLERIQILRRR